MKPERWQKLDELFHAALEREPPARAAFLDETCSGDESLRKQVAALLDAHDKAGTFIESNAFQREAQALANDHDGRGDTSAVGEVLGHYRIGALLGAGGMGDVYLAHDTKLGREVALKLLSDRFTNDPERVRRFQQEARAVSSLNHPNIITIYEIGEVSGRHFIATEYIDGETLRQHIGIQSSVATDEMPPKQISKTLSIAMQVADALDGAHAKGIVHRDIKPENIMLVRDLRLMPAESLVKVLDFGIAKLTEPEIIRSETEATTRVPLNTREGTTVGTASHMSPEQVRGEPVDARTDVWSLGVVLHEMLSHAAPFTGPTTQDVIASILRDEPAPLSPEIPDGLRWIVEKSLRKDRQERYQTARELFSDLRDLHKSRAEPGTAIERTLAPGLRAEVAGRIARVRGRTDQTRVTTHGNVQSLFGKVRPLGTMAIAVLIVFLFAISAIVFGLYKFTSRNQSRTSQNQTRLAVTSQSMKLARLTSTGKASAAAISPDGNFVVYVVDNDHRQSVFFRQVSSSSQSVPINVTFDGIIFGMTFSPGGESVYYYVEKKFGGALYQMSMVPGMPKKLITDIDSNVAFSPDGRQFAFVRGYASQGYFSVLVANADGTNERSLATHGLALGPFGDPAWSPDGKIIAYPAENTDANGDFMTLFEVLAAGGSEKPISSQRWWRVGRMAWLRDGSGLVVVAREDVASPSQIWYVSYPGGEAHRITNELSDYKDISLTADSSALVAVQSEQVSNIWAEPNDNRSPASQITTGKFDGLKSISWTPDARIVYDSGASGHLDLWIIEANGTAEKQLTADAGNNSWPSVSPDGHYVVFVSDRTGTNHLWRIDIDGSNATQLTRGIGESNPQCSPDGQWVAFNSKSGDLMKVPIVGGEAIRINIKGGGGVAISPDSKWIASTRWEPANANTAIYPFEGGEPSKLLDFVSHYFRWTPDGHSLAYVNLEKPSAIIDQPIDGSPPKQLAEFKPDRIVSFAWSQNGKQLAVARGPVTHDVILISNFISQR